MVAINIVGKNNPECPLCNKQFSRLWANGIEYYHCKRDSIAIKVNDPMVNHWNNNKDPENNIEIPCVNLKCKSKMNIFCRSDGYMKAVCSNPKCRSEVETYEE